MSSPDSFHTAHDSRSASMSDLQKTTSDAEVEHLPCYRPALRLSDEIRNHCHIYLDEQLYFSALTLLNDLVTAGSARPNAAELPAVAPLPFHIELIGTLLVHPRYTTQAPPNEHHEIASRSIAFLRNLLACLGPVNGNLAEAFDLTPVESGRRLKRSRTTRDNEDASGSEIEDEPERVKGAIYTGRLRRYAQDFWHVVGWAFNCSVGQPKRWQYWRLWLEYMLDVLDADWEERKRQDEESLNQSSGGDASGECSYDMLKSSLIVRHLSKVQGRSSAAKRVVKCSFANGEQESLRAYPEVFENETRDLKHQAGQKRKWEDETLEHKFGDYDEDDPLEDSFASSQSSDAPPEPALDAQEDPIKRIGGTESIHLRQRVLTLLSRVAAILPDALTGLDELYDIYYECIRPLPLPVFSLFLAPSQSSCFPDEVLVSLYGLLLHRLLPVSASSVLSRRSGDDLSSDLIETCFLPFCASTSSIDDNAKVSILAENALRLLRSRTGSVRYTSTLGVALEKGIAAREAKARGDRRRKEKSGKTKEQNDMFWLKASGERLRSLVRVMK